MSVDGSDDGSVVANPDEPDYGTGVSKLAFRLFNFRHRVVDRHSFVVGNDSCGVTSVIGWVPVYDREGMTMDEMRYHVECVRERGMNKRSPIMSEFIHMCNALENIHGRPESERRLYRFGRIRPDDMNTEDPYPTHVIAYEEEENTTVKSMQPCCVLIPRECSGGARRPPARRAAHARRTSLAALTASRRHLLLSYFPPV